MARPTTAPRGGKKQSRSSAETRVRKAARKREAPTNLEVPGTEKARDKDLEKYGRELGGLDDERKSNDKLRKACQGRVDRRLAEIGKDSYTLDDGRVLQSTTKRTVKLLPGKAKRKAKAARA